MDEVGCQAKEILTVLWEELYSIQYLVVFYWVMTMWIQLNGAIFVAGRVAAHTRSGIRSSSDLAPCSKTLKGGTLSETQTQPAHSNTAAGFDGLYNFEAIKARRYLNDDSHACYISKLELFDELTGDSPLGKFTAALNGLGEFGNSTGPRRWDYS